MVGVGEGNFAREKWLTEEQYFNEIVRQVNWKAKRRAKKMVILITSPMIT